MARTTVVHITDDLDGSKDAEAVAFAFEGVEFTIDLSKKNKTALEKALRPYMDAGTRVSRRSSGRRRAVAKASDAGAIRAWAQADGVEVSERGRIPQSVVDQYEAASS